MPPFSRLGKHSNRSQHAVAEPPPLPSGVSAATAAASGPGPGPGGGNSAVATAKADSLPADTTPQSTLSTSAISSSNESFVDARQQQQQQTQQSQQQQQQQQQPAHLYHSSSSTGANPPSLQNPAAAGIGASQAIFDGRQLQQQQQQQLQQPPTGDFADATAVNRPPSQRYSTHQQQPQHLLQQQLYGSVSTTSLDDLSSTANYQVAAAAPPPQPPAVPEKRSTRKLIKGIFSGRSNHDSGRDHHHGHSNSQSQSSTGYDNTIGLARRPSKRVSKPPSLKTSVSPSSQLSVDRDWQAPSSAVQQPSPLQSVGEAEEYSHYSEHPVNRRLPPQDSRAIPPINTIREVPPAEVEASSPYEELYPPPPHPPPATLQQLPAHVQVFASHDPQQQQLHFDTQQIAYDQSHPLHQPLPPQQYYTANPDPYQQAADPRIVTTHLGPGQQPPHQQQNPETVSQLSHESPLPDADQRSLNQQLEQSLPAVHYAVAQNQDLASAAVSPPVQLTGQQHQQSAMAPPGGGAPTSRRNPDADKALPGAPPGYRQSNSGMIPPSPLPGAPSQPAQPVQSVQPAQPGAQNPGSRSERPPQYDAATGEQGRNSPQPSTQERDNAESDKAFKELLTKYKNVKRLYFDGRAQIDQLTGQVEHLQNAVANQRMSQSRTALDDNEYVNRFNRLNGAIINLAFNIRKDWRCLPQWLESFVSPDAVETGRQEMTAVGRAIISRWIVEEIFNKCFHPGLDQMLSAQLKEIEMSIRGGAYTIHSQEEFDALTTKVVNWRMATLDGLQQKLNSSAMGDNRASLITKATTNLTACLYQYLSTPPPPGVEGSTSMIVELAVGIAANLPLESRDVSIMYPLPGDILQLELMELEKAGLPALDGKSDETEAEDKGDKDKNGSRGEASKLGFSKDVSRVRFAGFLVVEVRGRQVLMKAPVWTL